MGIAPIENLPVEILQPIFFASGFNVALLRASDRIALQLSSEYVYNSTCDHYLTSVFGNRVQQSAVQTSIFASRWMTWAFFKSWIIRRFGPKGCLCDASPDEGCFDAQWPPDFEDTTTMVFSRSHLPRLAFVKGRIPKKLLQGPWTQDKIQFLRFILWITSMTVDWRDPETRQLAINGRRQAISERNLEAVELFNHNYRLGKAADLSTLRFAVLGAGCDRSIVYDILAAANMWGKRGFSWDCVELDQWCKDRNKEGDPKGQWLRTKLDEGLAIRNHGQIGEGERSLSTSAIDGKLDPMTGDYDGGIGDRLVVNNLQWNKVSRSSFLNLLLSSPSETETNILPHHIKI